MKISPADTFTRETVGTRYIALQTMLRLLIEGWIVIANQLRATQIR
jgi:hypothetical protein